jgi:hypothetical protein
LEYQQSCFDIFPVSGQIKSLKYLHLITHRASSNFPSRWRYLAILCKPRPVLNSFGVMAWHISKDTRYTNLASAVRPCASRTRAR